MKNVFTNKLKSLLILILAILMAFSTMMSYACKKDGSSDTSSSSSAEEEKITEKTDYQVLKNGDFEYGTANTAITAYPASPTGWSKSYDSINSTNATTSSYGSGIIDTREYKYEYDKDGNVKKDSNGNPIFAKDENGDKIEVFKTIASSNAFPKYAYEYTTDEDGNRVYTKDADGNFIPKLDETGNNVEADPDDTEFFYYNPGTPFTKGYVTYDTTDKTNVSEGGKILMIHNKIVSEDGRGTAQYYKSSTTLTLNAGENGLFEAWVLTKDLESIMEDFTDFGAYVTISSTISSVKAGEVSVNNINTYGNWAKVEIYVKGSTHTSTELTVTFGLGRGSSDYKYEYAERFAFFDDAHFKVLKASETVPSTSDCDLSVDLYDTENKLCTTPFRIPYNHTESEFTSASSYLNTVMLIDAVKDVETLTLNAGTKTEENYVYPYHSSLFNVGATAELVDNAIVFTYANPSTLSYETEAFTVNYKENLHISFWVKTEIVNRANSVNGLTVSLMDKGKTASDKGTSVSVLSNFKTTKDSNKEKDDYTMVTVVVSNTYSDEARFFSLKFTFGATEAQSDLNLLPKGTATIKDFTKMYLSDEETSALSSSSETNVTKRTLQADYSTVPSEDTSKDSYTFNYGLIDDLTIKNNVVSGVQNYTGIVGGHTRTGGSNTAFKQDSTQSGLINSEYIDNYSDALFTAGGTSYKADVKAWLNQVENASSNKYVQPLMINNENSSYGYIGEKISLSTSSTYLISVKVKIFGSAKAYIYLSNADDNETFSVLGVDPITNTYTNETVTKGQYGYCIMLDKSDVNANQKEDGFATVSFLITTGKHDDKARSYRIEMWNGSRDGQTNSTGIVFFDSFLSMTSTNRETNLTDLKYTYTKANAYSEGVYDYTYEKAESGKVTFTQLPTLIKTNADPDGTVHNYAKGDKNYTSTIFMTNGTLENGIVKGGTFIISDLTSIDAPTEVDNTTSSDSSSSSSSGSSNAETTSYNPFLFATSIIISIALIIALIAVFVKHIITSRKKKRIEKENYYDSSTRDKAHEKILNKKAEQEKKAYDYDNMENNIEDESLSSEAIKEKIEETDDINEQLQQAEGTVPTTEIVSENEQIIETAEITENGNVDDNKKTDAENSTETENSDGENKN